jgi:cellulose synthase/poly-beta-1,6-N-acetylglucosamine synthase-like glycosyltransferase
MILGTTLAALLLALIAASAVSAPVMSPLMAPMSSMVGAFAFSTMPPSLTVVIFAGVAIVIIAVLALALEALAVALTWRPRRARVGRLRMQDRGPSGPLRVTVLIPAHDEEVTLPGTLESLAGQLRQPDRIVVVADNCTDRTVEIARACGVEVVETVGNSDKKAGALNQVLSVLLPSAQARDVYLVMDADTQLTKGFIASAVAEMEAAPTLAAVGGRFVGEEGFGLVGQLQRNEFTRYSNQVGRRRGRVFVLTGTATMFRAEALLDVAAARGILIPGTPGQVYDTLALTEDNELTLALKCLGATMISPDGCVDVTEVMPTWRALWIQRKRWQRGALENLSEYGWAPGTLRYWGQQVGIGYGIVALNAAVIFTVMVILLGGGLVVYAFWLALGAVFAVERVASVWNGGWRARALAAPLVIEIAFDIFLQAVFIACLVELLIGKAAAWGRVARVAGA